MISIAKRMQDRPNRVQTLIEGAYDLTYTQIATGNMPSATAAKYFPFVATLFFFIWFSNMLGYIPLPINTHETVDIFGIDFPAFALYAATANLSVPLVLTLVVWCGYQIEGMRQHGLRGHLKGWLAGGRDRRRRGPDLLHRGDLAVHADHLALGATVREHPRRPPADPVHGRRARGAARHSPALGWITLPIAIAFFMLEVGLIATLQAFIFATLTSIYFGEASAGGH